MKYEGTSATATSILVSKSYAPIQPFVEAYVARGYRETLAFLLTASCDNQHEIDGALVALSRLVKTATNEDPAFNALKRLFTPTKEGFRTNTSKEVEILQRTQMDLLRSQQHAARGDTGTRRTSLRRGK
jgi:hypothetical protein